MFEDFYCNSSDTEGRLAAGGHVQIVNYAVGCKLRPVTPPSTCIEFGTATCANASNVGEWLDNLVAGGDLYGRNLQVMLGNIAVGSIYNSDLTVNFQEDCTIHAGQVIHFDEWRTYLETLSTQICGMTVTGTATLQYGKLTLRGTMNPDVEVFHVQANTQLCNGAATSFDIVSKYLSC
jgi:choice-of-anchor A domain-containing protein